jgi:hypothetical protein
LGRRAGVALASLFGLAPLLACASLGLGLARALPDGGRECAGALVSTQQIEGEFLLRQRVRVQGEDLDWRLTLVAQKRGDRLVVIGFDAFGGKEFVLTQQGTEVAVERPRGRLPLPPIDLLRDLHRLRFLPPAAASADGVTLLRSGEGEVTIEHPRCGYRATWVALEATPPAAPADTRP